MKERINYFDLAKGIAIICIVAGHIYGNNFIKIWICSFHLPLFFIVTGCLIKYKNSSINGWNYFFKRLRRLIFPYFSFGLIFAAYEYTIQHFDYYVFKNMIQNLVTLKGIGALWFLPVLLIAEFIFEIAVKVVRNDKIKISLIVLICIGLNLISYYFYSNQWFLLLIRLSMAIMFICIGYIFFEKINLTKLSNTIFVILLLTSLILSNVNGLVDMYSNTWNDIVLYVINAIIGFVLVINISKKLTTNSLLRWAGTNSLTIMCSHQIIISIFRLIFNCEFREPITGTVLLVIVILLEFPIVSLVNNHLQFFLGISKSKLVK